MLDVGSGSGKSCVVAALATPLSFVPAEVTGLRTAQPIELEIGLVRMRVDVGTDPDYVAALVRSLVETAAAC